MTDAAHIETKETRKETKVGNAGAVLRLPASYLVLIWSVLATGVSGLIIQVRFNATMAGEVKALTRVVNKMEKRIDVDNATRYTVGEAARDMGLLRAEVSDTKERIADHEARIRTLERRGGK